MYCRQCGQRLDNDAIFCFHCGAGQEVKEKTAPPAEPEKEYCTQCGAELRQGAAFCVRCGAGREQPPIAEEPAEPLPEPPAAEPVPDKAFCIQCGAELEEGAVFCLMCGARQDGEAPVMAPTPKEEQPSLASEPAKAKKKGRTLAIVLPVFLLAVALGALMTLRPWEAREVAAPEDVEASSEERPAEEGEAPLQEASSAETPAPETTPAAGTEMPEGPGTGTAMTVTPAPTENTIKFSPVTEQNYSISTLMNSRLKLSLGGSDPSGLCVKEIDSVADVLFYIKLVDGDFNSGYHISSYHGNLQYIDGEPPTLNAVCREGLEDARWQFSRTAQNVYSIHLLQAPGYALAHEGERVFLAPYDEQDDRQQWIIEAPQPAPSLGVMEGGSLSQYILELSTRDITIEELHGLDEETVGYIRNGIYALAGKIFKTEKYNEYFSAQSWYAPYSDNNDLVTARFNSHMEHNLNVCIEYEKLMGWR